jgi:hypothetical protein
MGYVVAGLVVLAALYVGAYYAMVKPSPLSFFAGVGPWPMETRYRFGGEVSASIFAPLEQLDRRFFPARWEVPFVPD